MSSKTTKEYWENQWVGRDISLPVDPRKSGLNNHVNKQFDRYFHTILSTFQTDGATLLEVGCAGSSWLPYFQQQFGFKIFGLEYTKIGCEQASTVLEHSNIEGEIVQGDLFKPPVSFIENFDVIVTFGLVEHFEDTESCISALGNLLKPGGIIITNIPNMNGIVGYLQKKVGRDIYNVHVPLNKHNLLSAHHSLGLDVFSIDYVVPFSLGVINLSAVEPQLKFRIYTRLFSWISKLVWVLENIGLRLPGSELYSPYIFCAATKKRLSEK
jgi:2-polyprenyl-3-methyl-5-hydroxy-6-metoxy-1,4-benzoquinol methylase